MTVSFFLFLFIFICLIPPETSGLPPLPGGIFKKPTAQFSNVTVDVKIQTENATATIRGLVFSYGKSFRGIPYAQPPIGNSRFAYAQRKDPSGTVNASAYGAACTQKAMMPGTTSSENCLFINVFTPLNATKSSKLPVYMFYHFGGYEGGDGNMEEGIFPNLVNQGPLVMVSMNYRVGPFGFFTTRDSTAPGNWATSDWIEALNWVNRYIEFFGGDPQRITIGGQSAGAESVSAITMTPMAKSLFKQVILESGSSFDASIMSYSERTRNTSEYLVIALNCSTVEQWQNRRNFPEMLACMRRATSAQIMTADENLPSHRSKWSLVQDTKYFPESLEALAGKRDRSINVLCGNVNSEWMFFEDSTYMTSQLNSSRNSGTQLRKDLAATYEMTYYNNQNAVNSAADQLYIYSNGWSDNDHVNWEAKRLQLWSEMVFVGPVLRDASFFRFNGNTVYLYSLDWLSPNAHPEITETALRGVEHGSELKYLFETDCQFYSCTAGDKLLRQYFSSTWVNFIKFGNPTPSTSSLPFRWLPMDRTNRYLSFSPTPSMKTNYHPDANFWACTASAIDGYRGSFCE